MSIIKIKRSGTTGGAPTPLAQGEFAYSFLAGQYGNGGDRLFLGTGTETAGDAANKHPVGGYYYTQKLEHVPGTLTANAAIIVDASGKIDVLNIDNITIDGNTISSTNTDGDINIAPNGAGEINLNAPVNLSGQPLTVGGDFSADGQTTLASLNVTDLTANRVVYVGASGELQDTGNLTFDGSALAITGSADVDNIKIDGNTISATNLNGNIVIDPNGTGVIDASSAKIVNVANPTLNGDAVNLGFLDAQAIGIAGDSGANTVLLTSGTITVAGDTGITTSVSGQTITIDLDDTAVTPGSYGNTTAIPVITVDQQGRLTAASTVDVATQLTIAADTGTADTVDLLNDTLTFTGGTGVDTVVSDNAITISIGQDVSTTANVTFNKIETTDGLTVGGDLIVSGNVVSIAVSTLEVEDNMIYLNANSTNSNPDLGWAGNYDTVGDGSGYAHAGFFRDATDGVFKAYDGYLPEPDASAFIDTGHASFNLADIAAGTFIGALQGNADTATTLETARTIELAGDVAGSVSFDGSQNVVITATVQANSVALGTDTTGDYIATLGVTAGTGLSITGNSGESAAVTIAGVDATTSTKGVASFSSDNFSVTAGAVAIATIDGGTY